VLVLLCFIVVAKITHLIWLMRNYSLGTTAFIGLTTIKRSQLNLS